MTKHEPSTAAERQRKYAAKQREAGMVRRSAFIPADPQAEEDFRQAINRLRGKWRREGKL